MGVFIVSFSHENNVYCPICIDYSNYMLQHDYGYNKCNKCEESNWFICLFITVHAILNNVFLCSFPGVHSELISVSILQTSVWKHHRHFKFTLLGKTQGWSVEILLVLPMAIQCIYIVFSVFRKHEQNLSFFRDHRI